MNNRYDLIPTLGIDGVSKVFNQGINEGYVKHDWKNYGISELINKLKCKLNDFENLKDIDNDGLYNIDKVAAYALMIHDILVKSPHKDDRMNNYFTLPKIALDIDDVVCDFKKGFNEKTGLELNPYWNCNYDISNQLDKLKDDKDFWVNLPVLHRPNFEPFCYISSRSIPIEFTQEFIQKNGLPCAPVYHVPWNTSKIQTLKDLNIDILIDDKWENFVEANNNGIYCYLMNSSHNKHYDAKNRRIYDLNLFNNKIK